MSWIIQNLLRNRVKIKTSPDIESDDYNDLLLLEAKIADLYTAGLLSDYDIELIELISDGKPISDRTVKSIGRVRQSVSKDFRSLCDRLSFYIGGEFTDVGYLEKFRKKYNLSDEQIKKAEKYMKGRYRFRISRKHNK